jgi:hypothetical protein
MIRKTLFAALAIAALGTMSFTSPAFGQSMYTPWLLCVEFSDVKWNSRIVIKQFDKSDKLLHSETFITVPTKRCVLAKPAIFKTIYSVELHENGGFRMICKAENMPYRDTTLRVKGNAVGADCMVVG